MSDPKKEEPSIEDFKGILSWLEKKKTADSNSGSPWGWVTGLIAAAIAFFSIAIFAYKAWSKGREIAKLKHKVDVIEEDKIKALADKIIQKEFFKKVKLESDIKELENKKIFIEKKVNDLHSERLAYEDKINSIKSWDEVDKL